MPEAKRAQGKFGIKASASLNWLVFSPDSRREHMTRMLIHWIVSALLLLVVSHIVPGFIVRGFLPALVAALVMGLVNATLGLFLKILTFPLTIVTFGVFLLVINALMLLLTSHVVRGFTVQGFRPAFWGALLLAILQLLMRWLAPGRAI